MLCVVVGIFVILFLLISYSLPFMILSLHMFNYINCLIVTFHRLLLLAEKIFLLDFLNIAFFQTHKNVGIFERLAETALSNGRKIAFTWKYKWREVCIAIQLVTSIQWNIKNYQFDRKWNEGNEYKITMTDRLLSSVCIFTRISYFKWLLQASGWLINFELDIFVMQCIFSFQTCTLQANLQKQWRKQRLFFQNTHSI